MGDEPIRGFLGPGHYTREKIEIARRLRRGSTPAERAAWEILRRGGIDGWHFRRQQVIQGFVVDLFCARLRLVIELDGSVHDDPERARLDHERDEVLRGRGLRVVRLKNELVSRAALETIIKAATPPPTGGGVGEGAGLREGPD
jgi:very-short-patch-repair endonuclease